MEMCIVVAFRHQKCAFPKINSFKTMEMSMFGAFRRQQCAFPKIQKSQNVSADHPSPMVTANPFSQYLAPLGAEPLEKRQNNN
jgi:hypothetical protein